MDMAGAWQLPLPEYNGVLFIFSRSNVLPSIKSTHGAYVVVVQLLTFLKLHFIMKLLHKIPWKLQI